MRAVSVAGLVLASLTKLACAEDLLFYEGMLYNEYDEATKVLGLTAHVATDAEWRSYTTADFAKYKAIVIPDPNCGTIDRIKFLEDTKAVWSPAVKGKMIIIGTDPTYHSASRVGATHLIDDAVKFAASDPEGETGLYFSLSCYYDSGDITTIDALSEFGAFYVRGRLACYNDAHLVAIAAELDTVDDAKLGNWSCSVHEVFTEYPKTGITPGSDGFEALAIALNATGDGEETYGDGSSGIPYIIARGAIPLGCGNGKYEPEFSEECDNGTTNGTPGNPCSEACKCLIGVGIDGVCKLNTTSFSSTMSSTSSFAFNSSTALPSISANSTLAPSSVVPTSTSAPSSSIPESSAPFMSMPPVSMPPGVITVTLGPGAPSSPPVPPSSFPPNSSVPAVSGTPPSVTVVTSLEAPSAVPPSSESSPPATLVTTVGAPNVTAPSSDSSSPPMPAPPVTIVTTIGGPGDEPPRATTIVVTPGYPNATLPGVDPAPSGPAGSGVPSVITTVVTASGPSGAPGSVVNSVITLGGPIGAPPGAPGVPSAPSAPSGPGSPSSASPSFVTVVTSASAPGSAIGPSNSGPSSGTTTTTSAASGSASKPTSASGSIGTSVVTAVPSASGSGSPGTPSSPGEPSPTGPSLTSYTAVTIVETVSGPAGSLSSIVTRVSTLPITVSRPSISPGVSSGLPSAVPSAGSSLSAPASSAPGSLPSSSGPSVSATSVAAPGFGSPGTSTGLPAPSGGGSLGTPPVTSAIGSPSAGNNGTNLPNPTVTSGSGGSPTDAAAGSGLPVVSGSPTVAPVSSLGSGNGTTSTDSRASCANAALTTVNTATSHTMSASDSGNMSILPIAYPAVISASSFIPPRNATGTASNPILTVSLPTTLLTAAPLPTSPTCDAYIGIEIIYLIDIIEICPEGATVTSTITSCTSTMTRPICATSTTGYPCYPCIIGTPSAGETATVTRSSCTSIPTTTAIITGQLCSTCSTVTITTTIPGYTPGGGCKDCQPYSSGPLTLPLPPTTITDTVAATSTVVIPLEGSCPGHGCPPASYPAGGDPVAPADPATPISNPPGPPTDKPAPPPAVHTDTFAPAVPDTTVAPGYGEGVPSSTHPAVISHNVPYKPSTVPTAGGKSERVWWELMAGVACAVGYALLMV